MDKILLFSDSNILMLCYFCKWQWATKDWKIQGYWY